MGEDKLIDRIFGEIDLHTSRLEKLSKIVYTNAATTALTTKLVLVIIIFLVSTSIGSLYVHLSTTDNKPSIVETK